MYKVYFQTDKTDPHWTLHDEFTILDAAMRRADFLMSFEDTTGVMVVHA